MLTCLRVRNFAIIDELEVELEPGMNVVTGETGAGKSILIDALSLVLGARARPEVVRTGAEQAEIEALFDVTDDPEVRRRLEAAELSVEDELVLRRVVQRSGRSRAFINGRLAPAGQLADIAQGLCDISSQHEHHTLVDPRSHMHFLDAFAELEPLRGEVHAAYETLQQAKAALDAQTQSSTQRVEREDLLRFQLQEIDALALAPGEDAELAHERDRQRHAERLAQASGGAEDELYASDDALCARLGAHRSRARDRGVDRSAARAACGASRGCARASSKTLRASSAATRVRSRSIASGSRSSRSGSTRSASSSASTAAASMPCSIIASARPSSSPRSTRTKSARRALTAAAERARDAAAVLARKLSAARKKAAGKLADAVSRELASLSMGDARVAVEVARSDGGDDDACASTARSSARPASTAWSS